MTAGGLVRVSLLAMGSENGTENVSLLARSALVGSGRKGPERTPQDLSLQKAALNLAACSFPSCKRSAVFSQL